MARRRNAENEVLPPNLYERRGYYSWRNPNTGAELGIGRDRRDAIRQAKEANDYVTRAVPTSIVDRLAGREVRTVAAWFDHYDKLILARQRKDRRVRKPGTLAPNTVRQYLSNARTCRALLGPDRDIRTLTPHAIVSELRALAVSKPAAAVSLKQYLQDSFREAIVEGWLDRNPVTDIRLPEPEVRRARLTLPVFMEVYQRTTLDWFRNALALALVSAQRREDLALATFRDFHADGWHCEQFKTGNRIIVPMELRLDVFGMSLEDVVRQCRRTRIASRYLIHQTARRGGSDLGAPLTPQSLTTAFQRALAALGHDWGDHRPPSFHEVRSLSKRLYADQGGVDTKGLLGHDSDQTAAMYADTRDNPWQRVKITV